MFIFDKVEKWSRNANKFHAPKCYADVYDASFIHLLREIAESMSDDIKIKAAFPAEHLAEGAKEKDPCGIHCQHL